MKTLLFLTLTLQASLVVCEVVFSVRFNATSLLGFDKGNYTDFMKCLCTTNLTCQLFTHYDNNGTSTVINTLPGTDDQQRPDTNRSIICSSPNGDTPILCFVSTIPVVDPSVNNPNRCKIYTSPDASVCSAGLQILWGIGNIIVEKDVSGWVKNETCTPDPVPPMSSTTTSSLPSTSTPATSVDTVIMTTTSVMPLITPTPTSTPYSTQTPTSSQTLTPTPTISPNSIQISTSVPASNENSVSTSTQNSISTSTATFTQTASTTSSTLQASIQTSISNPTPNDQTTHQISFTGSGFTQMTTQILTPMYLSTITLDLTSTYSTDSGLIPHTASTATPTSTSTQNPALTSTSASTSTQNPAITATSTSTDTANPALTSITATTTTLNSDLTVTTSTTYTQSPDLTFTMATTSTQNPDLTLTTATTSTPNPALTLTSASTSTPNPDLTSNTTTTSTQNPALTSTSALTYTQNPNLTLTTATSYTLNPDLTPTMPSTTTSISSPTSTLFPTPPLSTGVQSSPNFEQSTIEGHVNASLTQPSMEQTSALVPHSSTTITQLASSVGQSYENLDSSSATVTSSNDISNHLTTTLEHSLVNLGQSSVGQSSVTVVDSSFFQTSSSVTNPGMSSTVDFYSLSNYSDILTYLTNTLTESFHLTTELTSENFATLSLETPVNFNKTSQLSLETNSIFFNSVTVTTTAETVNLTHEFLTTPSVSTVLITSQSFDYNSASSFLHSLDNKSTIINPSNTSPTISVNVVSPSSNLVYPTATNVVTNQPLSDSFIRLLTSNYENSVTTRDLVDESSNYLWASKTQTAITDSVSYDYIMTPSHYSELTTLSPSSLIVTQTFNVQGKQSLLTMSKQTLHSVDTQSLTPLITKSNTSLSTQYLFPFDTQPSVTLTLPLTTDSETLLPSVIFNTQTNIFPSGGVSLFPTSSFMYSSQPSSGLPSNQEHITTVSTSESLTQKITDLFTINFVTTQYSPSVSLSVATQIVEQSLLSSLSAVDYSHLSNYSYLHVLESITDLSPSINIAITSPVNLVTPITVSELPSTTNTSIVDNTIITHSTASTSKPASEVTSPSPSTYVQSTDVIQPFLPSSTSLQPSLSTSSYTALYFTNIITIDGASTIIDTPTITGPEDFNSIVIKTGGWSTIAENILTGSSPLIPTNTVYDSVSPVSILQSTNILSMDVISYSAMAVLSNTNIVSQDHTSLSPLSVTLPTQILNTTSTDSTAFDTRKYTESQDISSSITYSITSTLSVNNVLSIPPTGVVSAQTNIETEYLTVSNSISPTSDSMEIPVSSVHSTISSIIETHSVTLQTSASIGSDSGITPSVTVSIFESLLTDSGITTSVTVSNLASLGSDSVINLSPTLPTTTSPFSDQRLTSMDASLSRTLVISDSVTFTLGTELLTVSLTNALVTTPTETMLATESLNSASTLTGMLLTTQTPPYASLTNQTVAVSTALSQDNVFSITPSGALLTTSYSTDNKLSTSTTTIRSSIHTDNSLTTKQSSFLDISNTVESIGTATTVHTSITATALSIVSSNIDSASGPSISVTNISSMNSVSGAQSVDPSFSVVIATTQTSTGTIVDQSPVTNIAMTTSSTAGIQPTVAQTNSDTISTQSKDSITATSTTLEATTTHSTLLTYVVTTTLPTFGTGGATSLLTSFSTLLHPSVTEATIGLTTSATLTLPLPHPSDLSLIDVTLASLLSSVGGSNVSKTATVSQPMTVTPSTTSATIQLPSTTSNVTAPVGYNTTEDNDKDKIIAIAVGVVSGFVLIVILIVAIICCRRFQQSKKYRTMENGSTGQHSDSSDGSQDGAENNANSETGMKNLANFDGVIPRYPSYKDVSNDWKDFQPPYFTLIDIGPTAHNIIKGSTPDPLEFINPVMGVSEPTTVDLRTFKPSKKGSSLKSVHFENSLSGDVDPGSKSSTLARKGRVVKSVKFKNPDVDDEQRNESPPEQNGDYATIGYINSSGRSRDPVAPSTSGSARLSNGDVMKAKDRDDSIYSDVVPRNLRGLPEISQIKMTHAEESTHF